MYPGSGSSMEMGINHGEMFIYGVPVSARVYEPAARLMHAQTGICGIKICEALTASIFSFIIMFYLKDIMTLMPDVDVKDGQEAAGPHKNRDYAEMLQYAWIPSLIELILSCCLGSILVFISRLLIDSRDRRGLRVLCMVESICSCLNCCQAIIALCYLATAVLAWVAFSNPEQYCDGTYTKPQYTGGSILDGSLSTRTLTSTEGSLANPGYANCIKAIDAFKAVVTIFIVQLALVSVLSCIVASLCGTGAKFADDSEKAMEEEDFGDFGGVNPIMMDYGEGGGNNVDYY